MLDRAQVIDDNFITAVTQQQFAIRQNLLHAASVGLTSEQLLNIFDSQLLSRHIDLQARMLKEQGHGFYTIGSSGHEGNAAIAAVFRLTDMAFLHYRSAAFMLQRAKLTHGIDMVRDQLLSLVASSEDPIAGGRHKVLGSVALHVPPQTSTIASHLPKAVGAALSISRAQSLSLASNLPTDAVILCSFGDASFNHASAQAALNHAQWLVEHKHALPLVFICEDNAIGISVSTPPHWIQQRMHGYSGIHYVSADGLHIPDIYCAAQEAEYLARVMRQPVFLHMRCVRLMGHAGSDIESQYLTEAQIIAQEAQDPLLHSANLLISEGYATADDIIKRYQDAKTKVAELASEIISRPKLNSAPAVMAALIPPNSNQPLPTFPTHKQREQAFGEHYTQLSMPRNMCQLINFALTDLFLQYDNLVLFGEDVARKGGVYRVTADLQQRFGVQRVFDTLLDEQSILGLAIGLAHNGFIPMPEIQFLAYYHNAQDQIRGEAASLSFFSNGQFTNPMVVRIAGLAYQKGFGGHFHNDNSLTALRDLPGVIVACPSNGVDAVKMLRECVRLAYQERRVVIWVEPIALYMTRDLHVKGDQGWLGVYPELSAQLTLGEITVRGSQQNNDITIITYGNGVFLSCQAQQTLQQQFGLSVKIIDLHWLAPLPITSLMQAIASDKRILIVDEGRKTGSISEELMAHLLEQLNPLPMIKRITGEDTFIPLGDAWHYVLPSKDDIVRTVVAMVGVTTRVKKYKRLAS
ncbi:MAG: alpha-ketoacid dehydrogenase subunit alpha/beta [Gammaproteobacteria bacterium]